MLLSGRGIVIVAVALVLVVAGYTFYVADQAPPPVTSAVPSSFTVNGRTYTFNFTATDEAQWTAGLMNKRVTASTTMLFAFPYSSTWTFWMYDTNTSLDMIWLNATGDSAKVVHLVTGAAPCYLPDDQCPKFTPDRPANFVIEAMAGFAEANSLSVGTVVRFG